MSGSVRPETKGMSMVAEGTTTARTVSSSWADQIAVLLATAAGAPDASAALVARHLITADERGVDTHGLVRLPVYLDRAARGELVVDAVPRIVRDATAIATVDGGDGFGQVAAEFAMGLAIERAHRAGIGAVAVRRSSHLGAAAAYAIQATKAGCVGLVLTNTQPLMPAVGGADRVVGNNPIAIAAPTTVGFPIALDIAMSRVAAGRLRIAAAAGEAIPPDWAFDSAGEETTDPQTALFGGGLLRPVADHKGFGLAMLIDVLTGALAGGAVGSGVVGLDGVGAAAVSHLLIAIDVTAFGDGDGFLERVASIISEVHGSARREGVDRLLIPGQLEHETQQQRRRDGIPYPLSLFERLDALAARLGVALPPTAGRGAS